MQFTTDKSYLGYLPVYLAAAAELGPAARVCELGVYQGAGLEMFQALFPDGLIAGVDISGGCRWPEGTIRVIASQDSPDLPGILREHSEYWDLIADDASHEGTVTRASFDLLWPLVRPGGMYVIEDWMASLPGNSAVLPSAGTMLAMAQGLLPLLYWDSDVEEIRYRYGLVITRKRRR